MSGTDRNADGIQRFAEKHRLAVSRDECGDRNIHGKHGQIYEYGPGEFAVLYMPGPARLEGC